MPHADFVHLRVHSAYSLSEGAIKAEKIPVLARAAAMPAVAITDTSNLFGALEFSQACVGQGVQPIIGCQLALSREGDAARLPPDPVVLLAQDAAGLDNLQRLSSRAFLDTDPGLRPQVSLDLLAAHAKGLMLLTGGAHGPLGRLLQEGQREAAAALLARLAERLLFRNAGDARGA
jgi:DNA polymerase-3 subunit alpha